MRKEPKFEEQEVEDYLALKSETTRAAYSAAFRSFLKFYKNKYGKDAGFSHFLDRIFEEFKKPPREQKRVAETELTQFIDDLKSKGKSNNLIRLYFAALQNFLKYKQIVVSMGFINMPSAVEKKENGKHEWQLEQVKQFMDGATNYRDKALILCIFQSGLGVNEICDLNYGDVQDELEAGILPLCLKLVRQKTQVQFKSFFGRDAVYYLKLYLQTRGKLSPNDPLFIKERIRGGDERLTPAVIDQTFSEIAKNMDFIHQNGNGNYNAARPHSLRAAFNSRLINKIDEQLREFWMGHNIGMVSRAYLQMPTEDLRQLYATAETYLKIEKTSREQQEEAIKGKSVYSEILESDVKTSKTKIESLEQRVKMHEEIFRKMTDMSFDEFAKWMQEKNRWEWEQQREEDKKQISS